MTLAQRSVLAFVLFGCTAVWCSSQASGEQVASRSADHDEIPMVLPSAGASAAAAVPQTWLVGSRPGSSVSASVARRAGARRVADGTYLVRRAKARAFAAELRRAGQLLYAEPNASFRRMSAFESAGSEERWARSAVVPFAAPWPTPTATVAVIDDFVAADVPDVGGQTSYLNNSPGAVVAGPHGTAVASVISGVAGNGGVMGILPGTRILSYGVSTLTCADVAAGVEAAVAAKADIINISLGTEDDCFTLYREIQYAYGSGSLVVASAGNEFANGNPVTYPAGYPHVVSVAALNRDFVSASFSTANAAVDVSAPGVAVPVAIPRAFDTEDGLVDGLTEYDGTSFSAPIVAGVAAWVKTKRPGLSNGQLADVLRGSALDVGDSGYDRDTGWGLVTVEGALDQPTPRVDPLEPNDGVTMVDGSVFSSPDPYLWNGSGPTDRRGLKADAVEDPVDVYRIRLPGRTGARIRMVPTSGDPDMTILDGSAESFDDRSALVARNLRGPKRTESVYVRNYATTPRRAYVVITVDSTTSTLDASYRLEFRRSRAR